MTTRQQHAPGRPGPWLLLDQQLALTPDTGARA
ncbi:hypothetical protein JOD65_003253 [Nocardioides cavernae]|nr:hypothetical protein [Nocardioides cavernae]